MYSLYMSRMNKTHCGLFARMRLNYPISKGFTGTILGGMQTNTSPCRLRNLLWIQQLKPSRSQ